MANNKYYGYTPKKEETIPSEGIPGSGTRLDRVNPYEFRQGMDYELVAMGCSRLAESTPEERETATEKVIKNLEEHSGYYSALIQFETEFRNKSNKPSFKAFLKEFTEEYKMKEVDQKYSYKHTQMAKSDKMEELKEAIKNEIKSVLKEQGAAKKAAMDDMEKAGEVDKKSKPKGKKKDKPVRQDRFDKEEEAIKDILFRIDAKGKKPKEEGDYTKDNPAEGSMLHSKDEMLAKYKELKADGDDPKKTLEEYNKLLSEKNEEYKDSIEKFVEEFEGNDVTLADIYGEKLSDTIKKLQERLKLGLSKARAGVEEESRGMRREVALTEMTRDQHLRLLEICKNHGVNLREGSESIKMYYEIAKESYLEGVANALKL